MVRGPLRARDARLVKLFTNHRRWPPGGVPLNISARSLIRSDSYHRLARGHPLEPARMSLSRRMVIGLCLGQGLSPALGTGESYTTSGISSMFCLRIGMLLSRLVARRRNQVDVILAAWYTPRSECGHRRPPPPDALPRAVVFKVVDDARWQAGVRAASVADLRALATKFRRKPQDNPGVGGRLFLIVRICFERNGGKA